MRGVSGAWAAGANDRRELGVDIERAQDVADVGAHRGNSDPERCRDLSRIRACAKQIQHLSLPLRQLLHLGRGRNRRDSGQRAQQVNEVGRAGNAGGDR
jgi:hypothetical protein